MDNQKIQGKRIMDPKYKQGILIGLLIILAIFGPALVIYSSMNPGFNISNILSAGSAYAVALLTVGYVLTTSRQLDLMSAQLEEAKLSRELQNQPLPWIHRIKLIAEKPRVFWGPPRAAGQHKEYIFYSRYRVKFALKNLGNCPAISMDVSARIVVPQEDGNFDLGPDSEMIYALESGGEYPPDPSIDISLLLSGDVKGVLLDALRETSPAKASHLLLRILYKNILGCCFIIYKEFFIYPEESEHDSIIKGWLTAVTSFPVKYKDDIDSLQRLSAIKSEKGSELFGKLKSEVDESISGDDLELSLVPIPNALEVKVISTDRYIELKKNMRYGTPLSPKAIYSPPCKED